MGESGRYWMSTGSPEINLGRILEKLFHLSQENLHLNNVET